MANLNLLGLFLFGHYFESYFEKEVEINFTKINGRSEFSSPRALYNGGLGFVAALLVCWQIDYMCAYTGPQFNCNCNQKDK